VDELSMLDGVDDIPWSDLRCAGGTAGDVPALLRTVTSAPEEADMAAEELFGDLYCQGSVYEATPYAVPFLARIAAAGISTVTMLALLGRIGGSDDERELAVPGSARAALAAQIGVLAPLLGDPDDAVRATTAWALAQSRAPDRLVPLLRERWDAEPHPAVRATILKALSVLDPETAAGIAAGPVASDGDGGVRLIAARACVAAGQPWSDQLHDAATAWMADGDVLPGYLWGHGDAFTELIIALAARGDLGAAVRLVIEGLTRPWASSVRTRAMWSAQELARGYRSPGRALIQPLAAVVGENEKVGVSAIVLLRELDAAAVAADQLAAVAETSGDDRHADHALACLVELDDSRAIRLLARDLARRPFALDAASTRTHRGPAVPFDPGLFEAVRALLRRTRLHRSVVAHLLALLRAWGPAAEPAIPEMIGLLPAHPLNAGNALAAIAGPIPAAVQALSGVAATGRVWLRLLGAASLRSLTGNDEPLLAAIELGLAEGYSALKQAAEAARECSTAAGRLVPALTAALRAGPDATRPDLRAQIELALTLWHLTGDAAAAIPVLAEALAQDADPRGLTPERRQAADAAAVMGAAARPLILAIVPLLDNTGECPAAAQALLRIDPVSHGGVSLGVLADRLVDAVADPNWLAQHRAVAALAEIGADRLPPLVAERLHRLAAQDERFIKGGAVQHIIRDDERLRTAIRQLLAPPTGASSDPISGQW
jgi:HEAT repeat protein